MMMSVTRKTGYGRKSVLIVSLSLLVALLLSLPLSTQADAASNYKVKAWTMGMQCYTVYEGTLPQMYEPTFYTESIDTYRNLYTGKDIKLVAEAIEKIAINTRDTELEAIRIAKN